VVADCHHRHNHHAALHPTNGEAVAIPSLGKGFAVRLRAISQILVCCVVVVGAFVARASAAEPPKEKVIVQVEPGTERTVAARVEALGGKPGGAMKVISGFEAEVPVAAIDKLRASVNVVAVIERADVPFTDAFWDSDKVSSSLYRIAKTIGATDAWKDGYTGHGIDVAVVDSGIAALPEFEGRVVKGPDLSFDAGSALGGTDGFGHGTHMAGIIAGRARDAGADDELERDAKKQFVGIAPDARLIDMKVGAADGAVDVSQVIAAIDWVVQHRNTDGRNIRVLNLSFGTDGVQSYEVDPLTFAVENAWKHGIVVVVAAGNDGYGSPQLNNPAYDPYVIAVGAADTNATTSEGDDFIADFSSRGDLRRRPDVVAPGRSVVSLRAPGSAIDDAFATARVNDRLFRGSGTSQAAAVVSGAAALLLDEYPNLTPDQVKAALTATGQKLKTRKGELLEKGMMSIKLDKAAEKVKDVVEGKLPSVQSYPAARGTGSLEAARGSEHVVSGDQILSGEIAVTGQHWDGRTWRDESWNGRTWRGSDWTGRTWRANGWTGRTWRSEGWTGRTWRGSGWMGAEFAPTG
jgi:serine protease AprX